MNARSPVGAVGEFGRRYSQVFVFDMMPYVTEGACHYGSGNLVILLLESPWQRPV